MLSETIVGAEIENLRRKERIKAMVGVEGTQSALNKILHKVRSMEDCTVPMDHQGRQEFIDKITVIKSDLISAGMMIEEYVMVLDSIWEDYDKSTSFRMN